MILLKETLKKLTLTAFAAFFTLTVSSLAWGQQTIGTFPYMNGGFEGQTPGTLGTTVSSTLWSRQSEAGASSSIITNNPRSGVNYATVTNVSNPSRGLQSPQSTVASNGPATNTSYVLQFFVRNSSSVNAFQGGVTVNGTSNPTYSTAATLAVNTGFTKQTYILTTQNPTLTSAGIAIPGRSGTGVFDVDDVVVYAGTAVDSTAPNAPGTVTVTSPTTTSLNVAWGAASGGVDGGGYVVIRYQTNPNADNNPNQNGIYAVGNTINNGTGGLVGTVRYVGTGTNFTDTALSTGTTYYYKVYTVDKAFNYSTASTANGIISLPTVNLSVSSNSGSEANATAITVTATASSAVTGNQTVDLGVSGTGITAGDYTLTNSAGNAVTSITIPSGQTTGSVTFTVVNDTEIEGPETATLTISNPSSGIRLGTTLTQDITIIDNDDTTAPTITYTPLGNTTSDLNATIATTVTDNIGVPTMGGLVPRVYYKKNNASTYTSNACAYQSGNIYDCTIDYSLVGNVTNGDSITYFIVAQDTSGNLSSNPAGAMGSVTNLTMIPAAPNFYNIGLGGSIPSGTYSTLNTGGASLAGNVTVTQRLTVNGIINNGNSTITIDSSAIVVATSGYIIGNVTKNLPTNAVEPITFVYPVGTTNGYSPVTATFNNISAAGASLSVFAKQGPQPNLNAATSLQRYWTLASTGNLTANLEFSYLQNDVNGTESNYQVIRVENGTAAFYTSSSVDTTNNTFTATGVTSFSDWTLGETLLGSTAADGVISGRVINTKNRGLEGVTVTLSGGSLVEPIVVYTDQRGRYTFTEVPTGAIYTVTVASKRHIFNQPSTALNLTGNSENVNFVGEGW